MRKEQPTKRLQLDRTFAFDRTFLSFLDASIWRYFQRALLKNAENTITNRKLSGSLYIFSTANEKFPFQQANFIINFAPHVRTTNLLESSLWVINKSLKSSQGPFVDSPQKKLLFFPNNKEKTRTRERSLVLPPFVSQHFTTRCLFNRRLRFRLSFLRPAELYTITRTDLLLRLDSRDS